MKRTLLSVFAVILLGISIAMIIGASQKPQLANSTVEFPLQVQISSGEIYQVPPFELTINQPVTLLMGTISHVNVIIQPVGTAAKTGFPLVTESFQVYVESKLDLANTQIAPDGLVHALLKSDQETQFTWNIETDQSSPLEGTLWIYLALQPISSSTVTEELPLFAIPIDIGVKTVLGLSADLALLIGFFGCLISIAILVVVLYFLFAKRRFKKSK